MEGGNRKRIAIIGAGVCGLLSIKECLDHGLEPVCFEQSHDIGGLWRFKPDDVENEACVMKSTVINTSKEMMAFSDFPPPPHFSNFMHNTNVLLYFRMYTEHFKLLPHIRFETPVVMVSRTDDYNSTGKWSVEYRRKDSSGSTVDTFDGVLLCTGHHAFPHMGDIKGLGGFGGQVMHSHSYKEARGFQDKVVLVVGMGNSGGDIAVELARTAKHVYLVARRGNWVKNRISDYGYPSDLLTNRRGLNWLRGLFPKLANSHLESKFNYRFDHELYGLKPVHGPLQQHPCVNDDLPNRIQSGTITVVAFSYFWLGMHSVDQAGYIGSEGEWSEFCVDGSQVEGVDSIIVCTGYSIGFPYLEKDVIPVHENQVSLYKNMYPPDLPHPTLAVIGLVQPLGATMPISEMQCRLFASVLQGEVALPCREVMEADIDAKRTAMSRRYVASRRHTIQVDYVPFMDELAELLGVRPGFWEYLFKDPALARQLVFGPCLPYHFRLKGPHAWPKAREAILTVWDRVRAPTAPTIKPEHKKGRSSRLVSGLVLFVLLIGSAVFVSQKVSND